MLVLSARVGETVVINHTTEVTPLSINGNQVRLGFTAPNDISINRKVIEELTQDAAKGLFCRRAH